MSQRLSVVNGLVFDGQGRDPAEHPVHTDDGRIVAVDGPVPVDAEVIDARGGLVCPGLIDCHFHAFAVMFDLARLESTPASYVTAAAARRLRRALRRGFTTVRDVAGGDSGMAAAIEEGLVCGPRYLFTGRALSQTGGHGDHRPAELIPHAAACCGGRYMTEVVDGVEGVRAAARERLRAGAHAVKIFTSGGVVSPTDRLRSAQYSDDEIAAVCDEAGRLGAYVSAHAYSPDAIARSVANGVRTIEHGNLLDEPTAALMAQSGAYLVPTLIAYDAMDRRAAALGMSPGMAAKNRQVLAAGFDSIRRARAAGVPVGFGTDLMAELEDEQLHEFRLRVSAGEAPLEVLTAATSVNARIIRRRDLGRIGVGSAADLVVFDGNPLERADLLWEGDRTVVAGGRIVRA